MSMELAGGASTQSRARRPLPPGAIGAQTLSVAGCREVVMFFMADGLMQRKRLLSWVGGQAGLLWGGGPYPFPVAYDVHGSYGHAAEHSLSTALGEVYDGLFTSSDMACRFFANGSDACAAAVRVSRAATGRPRIATQGYHGAHTDFAHEPAWKGYPYPNVDLHNRFEFGDVPAMRLAARNAACIMVEVPAWDDEAAVATFLHACRDTADEYGIPFVIDDVVCGFRLALGGSCERYGVKADMVCLGKAMSAIGGVSALIGCADLVGRLADDVFYSTTFGGNPGPCSVAAATIRWLIEHRVGVYGHLRAIGTALKDGLNALDMPVVGQPERSILQFDTDAEWSAFCSAMIEQGVMMHRPQFPTLAHTLNDVRHTLEAAEAIRERA